MTGPILLAVPNVSEGRSDTTIAAIAQAFVSDRSAVAAVSRPRLLDIHSDADHHRSVFTLAGAQGLLADALLAGAAAAVESIDVMHRADGERQGAQHPYVGSVDVIPIVYLEPGARGAACAEALVVADRIGQELAIPVFLYGELTADDSRPARSRAELRGGGVAGLAERMRTGAGEGRGLLPDFGPSRLHPRAGAALVSARPPLVAFNLQLAEPATLSDARRIAALVREGGELGLPGLRAIGVLLAGQIAQVSMNIERPFELPLATVVRAVQRHAELASAELVGLAPAAALEGFPSELPMPGFDPDRHLIENALGCL
jgi:glutamate formiminotransferase/glutamate formiminotransferase/formiminotetrahydrofolate cyclodeaminase